MGETARVTYLRPDDLRILDEELDDHERRLRRLERKVSPRDAGVELGMRDLLPLLVVGCILRRIFR